MDVGLAWNGTRKSNRFLGDTGWVRLLVISTSSKQLLFIGPFYFGLA